MTEQDNTAPASTIDLFEVLPDLPTAVGLAGASHRAEVGGNVCFNTVIGIAIVVGR